MEYKIRKFNPDRDTKKPFNCGNADLNGFLLETDKHHHNATRHAEELLSETYVAVDNNDKIIAYFSLLNDKIERGFTEPSIWNKLSRKIPNAKKRSSYPALKIGRFAIDSNYQHLGIGKELIRIVQMWTAQDKKTGCRFITVDALTCAIEFYKKCDFFVLQNTEPEKETTPMCFDLKSIKN